MHRIDHITAADDINGPGKDGFTEGDPVGGVAPTVVTDDFMNTIQEEIANTVEKSGFTLTKPRVDQLHTVRSLHAFLNWTVVNHGITMGASAGVFGGIWDGDRFVLVGTDGSSNAMVYFSRDGERWTRNAITPSGANDANAIAFNGTTYVAVGVGGTIATSTDLSSWTARTPAASYSGTFHDVVWSATLGLFVAVGSGPVVQTSPTGVTWTAQTFGGSPPDGAPKIATDGNGNLVVAIASSASGIQTSSNGTTWTARTPANSTAVVYRDVVYAPELSRWVVVGGVNSGTTARMIETSDNGGVTWTARTLPTSELPQSSNYRAFQSIAWTGAIFLATLGDAVAVSYPAELCYSFDGITWKWARANAEVFGFGAASPNFQPAHIVYGAGRLVGWAQFDSDVSGASLRLHT